MHDARTDGRPASLIGLPCDMHSIILRGIRVKDFGSPVFRSIIHNNQLKVLKTLSEHTIYGRSKVRLAIMNR